KRLAEHDGVRMKLAEMATRLEAARRLTYYAAWCKDQGRRYTHEAAMAKLFASEASEFITREALQLHGGYGYSTEFPVERIYRDQRLMSIGEGANEILRLLIGSHVTADEDAAAAELCFIRYARYQPVSSNTSSSRVVLASGKRWTSAANRHHWLVSFNSY